MALRAPRGPSGAGVSADGWLELEARTNAHVRALAKGDRLVLEQCSDKALEGDVGELHTAARLLCRADQPDRFNALLDRIDWQDPARARAVADALIWDAPDSWRELVGAALADESLHDGAVGSLARVAGMRGWPLGELLLGVLEDRAGDLEAVAWAIGTLGHRDALAELYAVIQEPVDAGVRRAASLAALRFSPGEVLAFLEHVVDAQPWAAIPLALGGGPQAWPALLRSTQSAPTPERVVALGLLGCVGGIDVLLSMVEDEECGAAAAEGLYVLTGAPLHEEGQEKDPDAEPSEDEDDERPGLLVRRLPRSRSAWAQWLDGDGAPLRGRLGTRIRGGRAYEPRACLDELGGVGVSGQVRGWMLEELSVRYRLEAHAWPRLQETMRRRGIERARREIDGWGKVMAGEWYVAGQPLRMSGGVARRRA